MTPDKGEQWQCGDFSKVSFRHRCQEPKSHSITSAWFIHLCLQPNHMSDNHLAVEPAEARSPGADHVAYIQDDQWCRVHSPYMMEQHRQHLLCMQTSKVGTHWPPITGWLIVHEPPFFCILVTYFSLNTPVCYISLSWLPFSVPIASGSAN